MENQMDALRQMHCVACRADSPRVTAQEIAELEPQVPDWQVGDCNGEQCLERTFRFPNFAQALAFTRHVGELAEEENHHPRIVLEWGKVQVQWWTHKIHGLHRNDFVMAAKTDLIYQPSVLGAARAGGRQVSAV
jgi:4a-hydroxytetrahydrobiopterin dehydratase